MTQDTLSDHYASEDLLVKYQAALASIGATHPIDPKVLAPGDEFHIGGREATAMLLDMLEFSGESTLLDLGCGLGGPARHIASRTGAQVTGIDLTAEFVTTGNALSDMCALSDRLTLFEGSILEMPFDTAGFDAAYMLHVGMNIADKPRLMAEAARVIRPGGQFLIYDVMRVGNGDLAFPVPWASSAAQSYVDTPDRYRSLLDAAGFDILSQTDHHAFALDFFARMAAAQAKLDGPPALGLNLVLGADAKLKLSNMIAGLKSGHIAPMSFVAKRR